MWFYRIRKIYAAYFCSFLAETWMKGVALLNGKTFRRQCSDRFSVWSILCPERSHQAGRKSNRKERRNPGSFQITAIFEGKNGIWYSGLLYLTVLATAKPSDASGARNIVFTFSSWIRSSICFEAASCALNRLMVLVSSGSRMFPSLSLTTRSRSRYLKIYKWSSEINTRHIETANLQLCLHFLGQIIPPPRFHLSFLHNCSISSILSHTKEIRTDKGFE